MKYNSRYLETWMKRFNPGDLVKVMMGRSLGNFQVETWRAGVVLSGGGGIWTVMIEGECHRVHGQFIHLLQALEPENEKSE